jgi:hypothetical protein
MGQLHGLTEWQIIKTCALSLFHIHSNILVNSPIYNVIGTIVFHILIPQAEMEPVPVTGRSGPVPVWISDRPVTGRPARVLTLKFCFFHVKIYKTSVGFQEHLPDNI